MELSFVIAALKRRFWVVLIFAQLGALPFLLGGGPAPDAPDRYRSTALLEVLPPDGARTSTAQPDRYVLSQIEVLSSPELAAQVAEQLGSNDGPGPIRNNTAIEQITDTDIVSVTVTQDDPEVARLVAQTIVETYVQRQRQADEAARQPDLDRYDDELRTLREQLDDVNTRLAEIMAPFLDQFQEVGGSVPQPSIVAPNETAEQSFLITEIQQVDALRSSLLNQASSVNTKIVQNATTPNAPVTEQAGVFNLAFLVAMVLLGVTVALVWARLSPKLLDEVHAAEVLGMPVVANVRQSRALKRDPLVAFNRLPQELIGAVDQVAVQAEALAELDRPLTVAVVGSQRGSGTTTLAVALAARFAAAEYSVLLVDADRRDPWVSDVFSGSGHGGLPALLGQTANGVDRIFSRTSEPDVRVLGLAGNGAALRRESVPQLVEAAREAANIVIFDAGPLLDSASTVELANLADAIVLAVPLASARVDDLSIVARQLGSQRERVLPVLTGPHSSSAEREPVASNLGADSRGRDGLPVRAARPEEEQPAARRRGNGGPGDRPITADGPETSLAEAVGGPAASKAATSTPPPVKPKKPPARSGRGSDRRQTEETSP